MLGRMEDTNNNATELINENEILISTKIKTEWHLTA